MGIFASIMAGLGAVTGLAGGIMSRKSQKELEKYAKQISDQYGQMGQEAYNYLSAGAKKALENASDFQLATSGLETQAKSDIEQQRARSEQELANQGYTGGANDAYSNMEAGYGTKEAETLERIRNQAELETLRQNQSALQQAASLYSRGYNDLFNSTKAGADLMFGSKNARASNANSLLANGLRILGSGMFMLGKDGNFTNGLGGLFKSNTVPVSTGTVDSQIASYMNAGTTPNINI